MIPLPAPGFSDECFGELDHSCCETWDDYAPEIQERADALAVQTIRILTARRVGGCPITVRPCATRCVPSGYITASPVGGTFVGTGPHINASGAWVNSCGCGSDCSCGALSQVRLQGPVGFINQVQVDGEVLDPSRYRLDDGVWLVRTDGENWPACQDMEAEVGEPDTFAVTYLNAHLVDASGLYAAGILACEYAKACLGAACRLPAGVTEVTRQGVRYAINQDLFTNGSTGIREVDAYVYRYNPTRSPFTSRVISPDIPRPRRVESLYP